MSGRIMLDDGPQERQAQAPKPPAEPDPPPAPPQEPVQPPEAPPAAPPAREAETPPAAATGPGNGISEAPPEGAPETDAESASDLKRRIDRLTWEKYDAQRRAQEAERQMQAWQEAQRRAAMPPGADDPEARAFQRFQAEQAQRDFNQACNRVFEAGSRDYPDFREAVSALQAVGYGNRPDALGAIAAMPEGHHVYRALAQDLDNAARILALPPMHMAVELARMAHQRDAAHTPGNGTAPPAAAPTASITRAPAPLRPVGGNSSRPEKRPEDMNTAEWIRWRDKQTEGSSRIRR